MNFIYMFCFLLFFIAMSSMIKYFFLSTPTKNTAAIKKLHSDLRKEAIYRKVTQNELYWSEEKFNQLMKYAPIGMVLLNKQGYIIESNEALIHLSGFSQTELQGKKYDCLLMADNQECKEHFSNILKNKTKNNEVFETQFLTKTAQYLWVQLNLSSIRNKQNELEFLIMQIVNIDIDKKNQLNTQQLNNDLEEKVLQRTLELESKNKDLENFNYVVSHDLKAPLKNIRGLVDILRDDLTGEQRTSINHVSAMTTRMESLINNLFLFSKTQELNLHKVDIDLEEVIKDCITDLDKVYPKKATINIQSLPQAFGDKPAITQVCLNLLSNAIKYASKKPVINIQISGSISNDQLIYCIKDNGTGFDETQKNKLFKSFERLHKTSEYEGSGLGLAICQRIIHKHGGTIWAENNPTEGASFYFTLPTRKIQNDKHITNPAHLKQGTSSVEYK